MPYSGVPKDRVADMERCVAKVLAGGVKKFPGRTKKQSAIAICMTSLGFSKGGKKEAKRRAAAAKLARKK